MCGINGLTGNDQAALARMSAATAHRGPDATGAWGTDSISFGHNRLSIIDLSPEANQPMTSASGRYVIIFNGEIYNFQALKSQLADYPYKTQGDTEVLLAGYEAWGDKLWSKLEGIFAVALYDRDTGRLLLVRDQMGVKPLFYTTVGKTLYFSSELQGLLAGSGQRTIDPVGIAHVLTAGYIPSPQSVVTGVHKLPPGHLARWDDREITIERYYTPVAPTEKRLDSQLLRETIGEAIQKQLVSDRPVGVFLSGGLDSSIVLHHTTAALPQTKTFSVDYEMVSGAESESEKFNSDATVAEQTAERYGADHTTFTLTLRQLRDSFESILGRLDEPISNPTHLAQYHLSQWVREAGVVVALGGDGGDELFGGYTRHRIALGAHYWQQLPNLLQTVAGAARPRLRKLSTPFGAELHKRLMCLKPKDYQAFLRSGVSPDVVATEYWGAAYADESVADLPPLDAFMRVDRATWLAEESLARSDRSGMAHGLELRVPLLDMTVVNLADTVYASRKYTPWTNKKMLRTAYESHLPDYLFKQPKRGWISPAAKWLRDPAFGVQVRAILSDEYYDGLSAMIDWPAVQTMLAAHINKESYHLYPLWNLLVLQIWARHNQCRIQ